MKNKEKKPDVLELLAREALDLGATALEVEYRDGYEEVVAYIGALGRGIARFPSDAPDVAALRRELYACRSRPRRFSIDGLEYTIRAEVYENFGEDAFRVQIRRPNNDTAGTSTSR